MKKLFSRGNRLGQAAAILMIAALLFTGCDSDTSSSASSTQVETAAAVEEETVSEEAAYVGYDASEDVDELDDIEENLGDEEEEPSASAQTKTTSGSSTGAATSTTSGSFDLSSVADYSSSAYAVVNGNVPYFTASEITTTSYESYSSLDSLGRCQVAMACIGTDIMPTEARGSIGSVKPTGWHTVKYDCVSGSYLYNRCHLIAYELAGENANTRNLITGTRYMNVTGMLPFENMVTDFVKETGYHVIYRVTPIFEGDNLVASGVLMEALSVEDDGAGIQFCVYCYNVQPGIVIDYATGDSYEESTGSTGTTSGSSTSSSTSSSSNSSSNSSNSSTSSSNTSSSSTTSSGSSSSSSNSSNTSSSAAVESSTTTSSATTYMLNTNTKKFHLLGCYQINKMKDENKQEYTGTRDEIISMGYSPCGTCGP